MTYRKKSEPWHVCTVIDFSDGFVIYKYLKDGLYLTVKSHVADFYRDWEIANAKQ